MLTGTNRLIFTGLAIAFIAAFAMLGESDRASAAPFTADPIANSCLSCHEDLYYLHDSGCWYCMTEAHRDRCTDCHEGNAGSFMTKEAHFGLLRHPQEGDGAKCRQCHTRDAQARIDAFAVEHGGFDPVVEEAVAYKPAQPVETGFPETAQPDFTEKLPWAAGATISFGLWLALVILSPQKP